MKNYRVTVNGVIYDVVVEEVNGAAYVPYVAPAAPVAPVEAPKAAPKAEAPKREKPKSSADEELDRLMKEFGTPKKKKINR